MYRELICSLQEKMQAEVEALNVKAGVLRRELEPIQTRLNILNQMLSHLGNCTAWVNNVERPLEVPAS